MEWHIPEKQVQTKVSERVETTVHYNEGLDSQSCLLAPLLLPHTKGRYFQGSALFPLLLSLDKCTLPLTSVLPAMHALLAELFCLGPSLTFLTSVDPD